MKVRYLVLIGFLLLTACGKKGPLVPPESFVPAPVSALSVEQKEGSFYVSWPAPSKDEGGRPVKDLAGFRVYRRPVLPSGQDCEECPTAYTLIKTVDLDYLQDVRFFNNRYVLADGDVTNGVTYQYKVISFKKDGTESSASNRARLTKVAAPPAPRLAATASATGVLLQWEIPPVSAGKVAGAYVYRRRGNDVGTLVLLTPAPVSDRQYEDLRLERGATYVYTVRAVVEVDGQLVEGAVSNEAQGKLAEPE
ncbi:fibronectin type III domain-containing protein [Geobacter hydrogenophilus]|uniref:Lipoprotein n=1 Tax=Geobacter hydrogenophilus TaxID=40983 RepID=A0A9W6G0H9_9BACT|nr:fibronectin type III domain-containing protein [Geobacter hydrogenophilus]MBT0893813.1 fibronectin type III domain-containing protein [Geobacter hydrogenophilus]GLI38246.1 lipoprotein [Geobacter hydrogenophilus]